MHLRTLYFRNLLTDIKDHWLVVLVVVLICGAGLGFYGYLSAGKKLELSEEQKEKIAHFEERVASYDAAIEDTQKCIDDNTEAIENLQNYIDNSIYMKLDPDNLQINSVQYVVTPDEGVSVGNVQNSIISFINDGGLVSSVSADDGSILPEYIELNPSYWRDVVSISCPANLVVITVVHYDHETGAKILNVIREKLASQCTVIREKQGGFSLDGEEVSALTKGDVNVANAQNNNLNNLRSYQSIRSDYEAKFVNQTTARESYIEANEPEELQLPSPKKNAVKYGVFGLIAGAVLVVGILALKYIFSDRIRREEELQSTGVTVLAKIGGRKGLGKNKEDQRGALYPSADRIAMDLKALTENFGCKGVYLQDLGGGSNKVEEGKALYESRPASEINSVLKKHDLSTALGTTEGESPEELKEMIHLQGVLLLIEAGKTTFRQLEKQLRLSERFGIKILGCILYE